VIQALDEILILCLCDVVSGCEGFVDIAPHVREKREFLRRMASFGNGIPSHDALSAVFRALDSWEAGVAFPGGRPGWPDGSRARSSPSTAGRRGGRQPAARPPCT